MENTDKFYGEWVYFDNEVEKKEAIEYLNLWKKFMIKKLPDMKQKGKDQFVERNFPNTSTLGLKICMFSDVQDNLGYIKPNELG